MQNCKKTGPPPAIECYKDAAFYAKELSKTSKAHGDASTAAEYDTKAAGYESTAQK